MDKQAANRDTPVFYVGLVAPISHWSFPKYYDMYPEGSIPEPKLHPATGYNRHPEAGNGNFNAKTISGRRRTSCAWLWSMHGWITTSV